MPPHEPSASWRATIHRSARARAAAAEAGRMVALVAVQHPVESVEAAGPRAQRPAARAVRAPVNSSSSVNGSGRTGRWALTTVSGTIVWRAQQAKS